MPKNMVARCMNIIDGSEADFIASFLGCTIPDGREDDCKLMALAFAETFPQRFVKALGAYLHDVVEVA